MKIIFLPLLLLGICSSATAQWTTDSIVNTAIADNSGAKYVPKIRVTPQGHYYISWYDNNSGNLNMKLQLLNFDGTEKWQHNGIVVSSHPQNSSVTDYDLEVDSMGNAILAFTDMRNGNQDVVVYKIDTNKNFLYGPDGIVMNDPGNQGEFVPQLAITPSSDAIVTWMYPGSQGMTIKMQKIDQFGALVWGASAITLPNPSFELQNPRPVATSDGGMVLVYHKQTGPFFSPDREIYAQRYDANGSTAWPAEVQLCGVTGIPGFADLKVVPDNRNGAIVLWSDDPDQNNLSNTALQHIKSDGTLAFSVNGVQVGSSSNENHYDIIPAGIASDSSIIVYWTVTNGSQSQRGLKGQKVSSSGTMLWGSGGKTLIAKNDTFSIAEGALLVQDTSYLIYNHHLSGQITQQHLLLKRITPAGNTIGNSDLPVSISNTQKIHFDLSAEFNWQFAMVWESDASGPTSIKGQNYRIRIPDTTTIDTTNPGGIQLYSQKSAFTYYGNAFHINSPEITHIDIYALNGQKQESLTIHNKTAFPSSRSEAIHLAVGRDRNGEVIGVLKFTTGGDQ